MAVSTPAEYAAYTDLNSLSPSSPDIIPLDALKSDVADLTTPVRGIRATVAGNVKVTTASGNTRVLPILAGETRMVAVIRYWNTGTTATGVEGLV